MTGYWDAQKGATQSKDCGSLSPVLVSPTLLVTPSFGKSSGEGEALKKIGSSRSSWGKRKLIIATVGDDTKEEYLVMHLH